MDYLEDSVVYGEDYNITASPRDGNGDIIILDGSWDVDIRFSLLSNGVGEVFSSDMPIVDGEGFITIDTGDSPWYPGIFWYDIRFTNPNGSDFWSCKTKLTIKSRITNAS